VQIGDEYVHRVRSVMDEVFGDEIFVSLVFVQKTSSFPSDTLANVCDYLCWYAKKRELVKVRQLYDTQPFELGEGNARWLEMDDFTYRGVSTREVKGEVDIPVNSKPYKPGDLTAQGSAKSPQPFEFCGITVDPSSKNARWKANYPNGLGRLRNANRIHVAANSFQYRRHHTDYPYTSRSNVWTIQEREALPTIRYTLFRLLQRWWNAASL
jgi:adenine-specific DNA-methyltransferase